MSPRGPRYKANNASFGKLMVSDQIRDVAQAAARDVVLAALPLSPEHKPGEKGAGDGTSYREHFSVDDIVVTLDGNPRAATRVVNDADYAAQVEFGTGPGWSGERVQGGNPGGPHRVLGRAGAKVGEYHGGVE